MGERKIKSELGREMSALGRYHGLERLRGGRRGEIKLGLNLQDGQDRRDKVKRRHFREAKPRGLIKE